jgi:hypothetical protein
MHKDVFRKTALPEKVGRDRAPRVFRRKCFGAVESTAAEIILEPVLAVRRFTLATKPALSAGRVCHHDVVSGVDLGYFGTCFEDNSRTCKIVVSLNQQVRKIEC